MKNPLKTNIARFVWGDAAFVRSQVADGVQSLALVDSSSSALPGVVRDIVIPCGADDEVVLIAGVLPEDITAPRVEQAASIFRQLERELVLRGMTFDDVIRTWFYVDKVCEWYGEFNAARTEFFEKHGVFDGFLPASTGIGSANVHGAAIVAGLVAAKGLEKVIVESPLQAPAMAYKSSFSRAAELVTSKGRTLFISGTASIKPNSHEVAYVGDIDKQIICTMNAVRAILESRGMGFENTARATVYLKKPEFLTAWHHWLEGHPEFPQNIAAETVCDVCRDEWLFEIELDGFKGV